MNGIFTGFDFPAFHHNTLKVVRLVGVVGLLAFGFAQSSVAQRVNSQEHHVLYEQGCSPKQEKFRLQAQLNEKDSFERSEQLRGEKTEFVQDGYRYVVTDEEKKEVQLIRLKAGDTKFANRYDGKVEIPTTVKAGETTYTVTSIGRSAFYTSKISSLKISESIRKIEKSAFAYVTDLKEIHIPDNVEKLGERAFAFCNSARSLYIGKKVAKVGEDVFEDCYYLQKIEVGEGNPIYSLRDGVLYNKDQSELLKCPSFRKDFKELTLPPTVKTIAKGALEYCFYISKITLNDGLESIHDRAFKQNYALTALHIPASVKYIANGSVFAQTKKLSTLTVDPQNKNYKALENILYNHTGEELISHPAGLADSLMVKIPDGVKIIGRSAFEYCRGVRTIQLPESVDSLGNAAFSDCGIIEFRLPEKVKTLSYSLFTDCTKLTRLYLGSSVTTVSNLVFEGCNSLENIQIKAVVPPVMEIDSDGDPAFISNNVKEKARLEVLPGSVDAYKAAPEWKEFTHIVGKDLAIQNIETSSDWISVRTGELVVSADSVLPIVVYDFSGRILAKTHARTWSLHLPEGNYIVVLGTQAHRVHID